MGEKIKKLIIIAHGYNFKKIYFYTFNCLFRYKEMNNVLNVIESNIIIKSFVYHFSVFESIKNK